MPRLGQPLKALVTLSQTANVLKCLFHPSTVQESNSLHKKYTLVTMLIVHNLQKVQNCLE